MTVRPCFVSVQNGCFLVYAGLFGLLFLLFEDFESHVVDSRVIENNDATVRTRFDMNAYIFTKVVVAAAEVVAYGLNSDVEFVSDFVHRTIG